MFKTVIRIVTASRKSNYGFRYLYSHECLGIDRYIESREKIRNQHKNMIDKFKERMNEFVSDDSPHMIFTEDVKNIIHLANNDDIDLVNKMIRKYKSQNSILTFGSFTFGPVIMRLYHYLQKPDEALKIFQTKELDSFFDQSTTYQILLDLLYENIQYNDVLRTYDFIKTKQNQGNKYPRHCIVLVFAACYKLNNKHSYEYMLNLWRELNQVKHVPTRRAVTFAAGLAYRQKDFNTAIEILSSSSKHRNHIAVKSINILCLAELSRIEDALMMIKSLLNQDVYSRHYDGDEDDDNGSNLVLSEDVLDRFQAILSAYKNKEWNFEFEKIKSFLRNHNRINSDQTLEKLLCQEIDSTEMNSKYNNRTHKLNTFNKYTVQRSRNVRPRRPSLKNMD